MRLVVVLDIDNTLINAEFGNYQNNHIDSDFEFMVNDDHFKIWKRPGLDEFLTWLFDNHDVAFWSASSKNYVDEILKNILKPDMKPLFVWSSNKCTIKRRRDSLMMVMMDYSVYIIKDLNKFWKKKPDREELKRRTVIVDDNSTTYIRNYGNALPIEHFDMKNLKDKELDRIKKALIILSKYSNVRHIEKRSQFPDYLQQKK